jgi:Leucine Rich repeat
LHSTGMPSLRTLALRNSELADETAPLLAAAPLMQQPTLETLDLSMGTLSDAGAQALLENPHVARMRRLHLDHHYMSEEMMRKLEALPLVVTMDDQQEADEDDDRSWRYVQVGE